MIKEILINLIKKFMKILIKKCLKKFEKIGQKNHQNFD